MPGRVLLVNRGQFHCLLTKGAPGVPVTPQVQRGGGDLRADLSAKGWGPALVLLDFGGWAGPASVAAMQLRAKAVRPTAVEPDQQAQSGS